MIYHIFPNTVESFQGYQYAITTKNMLDFHTIRSWCNETFGTSERDVSMFNRFVAEQWAWHIQYRTYQIFLKSDQEVTWFKLKFGSETVPEVW